MHSEKITFATPIELVACCIYLNKQTVILISAYRPPINNYEYLDTLCSTISSIILSNSSDIIWLGGDPNLLNIDWNQYSVKR